MHERRAAETQARREEILELPTVDLRHRGELEPPMDGDVLVDVSVSPLGDAVALWAQPAEREELLAKEVQANGVRAPRTRMPRPVTARFVRYGRKPIVIPLQTDLAVPLVQVLSGDRVLVVGARCRHRGSEGSEHNAAIYDMQGHLLAAGTLGDGIERVRTDVGDGIWVGYSDQGINGDLGWGGSEGPEPIGRRGLVRFTDGLAIDRRFPVGTAWPLPVEACRFTLVGTTAWVTYHNRREDLVVRFEEAGRLEGWALDDTSGGTAVPIGPAVVLVGGWRGEHDLLTVVDLADTSPRPGPQYRLSLPDNAELGAFSWHEHRNTLHVFTDMTWWTAELLPDIRPSGRIALRTDSENPQEARYIEARQDEDYVQCVRELLAMKVWLPVKGPQRDFIVAHRGNNGLVRAYTSAERAAVMAGPDVDPTAAVTRRFWHLVEGWRHPDIGLVINPDSASEFQIPVSLFGRVREIMEKILPGAVNQAADTRSARSERSGSDPSRTFRGVAPPEIDGFRFARLVDGIDEDGQGILAPERSRIDDPQERQRILGYLRGGAPVMLIPGFATDLFDPSKQQVVPMSTRTDGRWVWSDGAEYYLETYGIAPEPDLYLTIREAGYACPGVPDPVVLKAGDATTERHRILNEQRRRHMEGDA
ncbi:SseB family protein [Actinomadura sp. B10D3]|uniref:SseB family protein n=1 Tax=Actinomadura sp. B10D3 TaxID=3153557 RepID=UPI00325D6594